jgi:GntR family transcriptional repressor for pyruvate dehydrogenase complex
VSLKRMQSKIKPIRKVSISEEIAQQIMNLISTGDLKPGQRLPSERELCRDFHAGRSSLREALRCLSIMGVLNARVGEGTSVALDGAKFMGKIIEWRMITERHDIENLLEVRMALEGLAAAKVATFGRPEDLAQLHELIKNMAAAKDAKRFAALDLQFHIAIADMAENSMLSDLISMIRSQLVRALAAVLLLPNALKLSHQEHVAIYKAVEKQDPTAARDAAVKHLQAALKRYRSSLV